MHRYLAPLLLGPLAAFAAAQEVPGLRVALFGRSLVPSHAKVELRLLLQVDTDTEVPADLLSGMRLAVKIDDQPGKPVVVAGKGAAVPLLAGTRIERLLSLPAASLLPSPDFDKVATAVVSWEGMAGTSCVFKIAPDTRQLDVAKLDLGKTQVVLVTSHGEMRVSFRPDKAPHTVENFVRLCLQGFYDGTRFHRVKRDFMIQGGCPKTKDDSLVDEWGTGGPGYTIHAEFNDLRHLRGTLSMARTSEPNSAGSGFFIVHQEAPHLDGKYSAFGNIEEGADTLDRIAYVPVGGPKMEMPLQPVVLHAAIVLPVKK